MLHPPKNEIVWAKGQFKNSKNPHVLFGHAHEDLTCEILALQKTQEKGDKKGKALCVLSGGCQPMALLLAGAHDIIAIDVNPAQHFLFFLKRAIIEKASAEQAEHWMTHDARETLDLFGRSLSIEAQNFWKDHKASLRHGLCFCGEADQRLRFLNRWLRPIVLSSAQLNKIFSLESNPLYLKKIFQTRRWLGSWKILKCVINLFYQARFRAEMPRNAIEKMRRRFEEVFSQKDVAHNPWLHATLSQKFGLQPPPWLTQEAFTSFKNKIKNITTCHTDFQTALQNQPPHSVSFIALSNITDTLNPQQIKKLWQSSAQALQPAGLLVVRSMFKSLEHFPQNGNGITLDLELTDSLKQKDRSPLCSIVGVWKLLPS